MQYYICGVQLTVGVWLTIGFPCRNPGVKGEGTMSVDIANVPNPLTVVRWLERGGWH